MGKWNRRQSDETASVLNLLLPQHDHFSYIILVACRGQYKVSKQLDRTTCACFSVYRECIFGIVKAINFPFYVNFTYIIVPQGYPRWQILKKYYPTTGVNGVFLKTTLSRHT